MFTLYLYLYDYRGFGGTSSTVHWCYMVLILLCVGVFLLIAREPQQPPIFTHFATVHNPPASLNISWNPPALNATFEAPITGYELIFFTIDTSVSMLITTGPETLLLQSGLMPSTEYEVTITALNLIGRGPVSVAFSFTSGNDS